MSTRSLDGASVLVTGANRGLGVGFVEAALDHGASRVLAGARSLEHLGADARRFGPRLVPVLLDVTDPAHIAAAADLEVDLLVSNAGIGCPGGVLSDTGLETFRRLMEVNVFGPLALFRVLAPGLVERRGGVLAIVSISAIGLSRSSPVYSASKAAALMTVMGLREELRADGVQVTASLPGFIATDLMAGSDMPKASSREVADSSIDGYLRGEATVFPDLYAELVRGRLCADPLALLDAPAQVMNSVVSERRAIASGSD